MDDEGWWGITITCDGSFDARVRASSQGEAVTKAWARFEKERPDAEWDILEENIESPEDCEGEE